MDFRHLCLLLTLYLAGCAVLPLADEPPHREYAEWPLANCEEGMDDPHYWIKKFMFKDQLLLTSKQIQAINKSNYSRGLLTDVFSNQLWDYDYQEVDRPGEDNPEGEWNLSQPSQYSPGGLEGYTLYTYLKDETARIKRKTRYDSVGWPVTRRDFDALDENLNLSSLRENNPLAYGLTRRRTDVRYYPTEQLITGKRWNVDFDILQVTAIRAHQPLAILHISRDKAWFFVVTAFRGGWDKREDVLENCKPRAIRQYLKSDRFLVVTGHQAQAVWAPGTTAVAETFYLGTVCALESKSAGYYTVQLPVRARNGSIQTRRAYFKRNAPVHEGFLPCTPRMICRQAFKLLHHPYSWGGRGEHRDCSQFMMDLYATLGIVLPRNSSAQGRVGQGRFSFSARNTVRQRRAELDGLNQPVLLQFPGHIMLYLGREGEHYYAIHDIWAYRVLEKPGQDRKIIIGKIVVSDLSLGEGSTRGSLLERLTTINLLRP